MGQKVWVTRPFTYAGVEYDRGGILELGGHRNDERLLKMGYMKPVEKGATTYKCSECGQEFLEITMRTAHGDKRHVERNVQEQDLFEDREQAYLEQVAPISIPTPA